MIQFARFFSRSFHNTLKVMNGANFSYKPQWVTVYSNTVLDQWYVGDFMAAEYTIVVDAGSTNKEIVKCLVVAGPDTVNVTTYGRTNLSSDLVTITASIDSSKVELLLTSGTACKAIFSANYYHTLNQIGA